MRSTMSAFVMVMCGAPSGPELEAELVAQTRTHRRVQRVDLVVGERPVGRAVGDGVRQALLPARDRRAAVAVEQPHGLDLRVSQRPDDVICSDGSFLFDSLPKLKNVFVTYPFIRPQRKAA